MLASILLTFGAGQFFVAGVCFLDYRRFRFTPGLSSVQANSKPPVVTTKNFRGFRKRFLQKRNICLKNVSLPDRGKEEEKIMSFWTRASGLYFAFGQNA